MGNNGNEISTNLFFFVRPHLIQRIMVGGQGGEGSGTRAMLVALAGPAVKLSFSFSRLFYVRLYETSVESEVDWREETGRAEQRSKTGGNHIKTRGDELLIGLNTFPSAPYFRRRIAVGRAHARRCKQADTQNTHAQYWSVHSKATRGVFQLATILFVLVIIVVVLVKVVVILIEVDEVAATIIEGNELCVK